MPTAEVYVVYRDELEALLPERGRKGSDSYDARFSYSRIAAAGTAAQMAVEERLVALGEPIRTAGELQEGASQVLLPPNRETLSVSRNLLETLVAQAAMVAGRLGVNPAAANRTLGWGMRTGLLVPVTGLMTVTRTIEQERMRRGQMLGVRSDGDLDIAAVVGLIPDNGGAALLHAAHPHLQDVEDAQAHLVEFHEHRSGIDLHPLRMRLVHLHAVWIELRETMGVAVPIVQRAERRFDQPDEGSATAQERWHAYEQTGWSREVDAVFPPDAVVMAEISGETLTDFTYRTPLGERRIGNFRKFLRDVENGLPSLLIHNLTMSRPEDEKLLEGADPVVRLEGHLISTSGLAYRPVVVVPAPQTECVVYLIPADRAATMDDAAWDRVRLALATIHGSAWVGASDDQGLGGSLPRKHGLSMGSVDINKLANFESLRCFSHAITERSHWRPPDGADPGGARGAKAA